MVMDNNYPSPGNTESYSWKAAMHSRFRANVLALIFLVLALPMAHADASKEFRLLAEGKAPDGAAWMWQLQYWPGADRCVGSGKAECGTEVFHIRNDTDDVLECWMSIEYKLNRRIPREDRADYQQISGARVQPHDAWNDPVVLPAYGVPVASQAVECKPYKPEPPLPRTEGCSFKYQGPGLEYPQKSQDSGERGVVRVRFFLENAQGPPTQVKIVDSSMRKRLDDSALRFVQGQQFTTTCAGTMYEIGVAFAPPRKP
jgi:TonB family protein